MYTLSLDTTGAQCSAALVSAQALIDRSVHTIGRGHAEHIGPQVSSLLRAANITPAKISRLAVCTGPGSFTGLRVGIALAKGLALPRNLPVIGISALQVWASAADPESTKRVISIADIRRNQVQWQIFDRGQPVSTPQTGTADEALAALSADIIITGIIITGSGAPIVSPRRAVNPTGFTDPAILAWMSIDKDAAQYPPTALYSRPPDAKLPGGIAPP